VLHILEILVTTRPNIEAGSVSRLIGRHSSSLTTLDIREYLYLTSNTVQLILCQCSALVVLELYQRRANAPPMTLEDAVANKLACKRIRRLRPCIDIEDTGAKKMRPWYRRSAPIVLTDAERVQFEMFERLFRQLGELKDLERFGAGGCSTKDSAMVRTVKLSTQ